MPRRVPALVFLALAFLLLFPLIVDGEVYYFRDFGRYYSPVKEVCLGRMARGEFPLWLPEINCGTPVHGELVHALLYPGNLLLFAGGGRGWGLYFAFHLFLAGFGAYGLSRRLGASDLGALASGIAYAGSGYLVAQLNHVPYATAAAWLPFVVHLGLRAGDGRRAATPLLALALAATALAGEPFTLLLGLAFLLVLILAGCTESRLRAILRLGLAGVVAILLASPALLPAWQQLSESMRARGAAPEDLYYGSVHPVRLLTLLSPEALGRQQVFFDPFGSLFGWKFEYVAPVITNLHLGALTLLGVIAAFWRRSRLRWVLLGVFVVGIVFALGAYVGVSTTIADLIPGLALFRYPDKYWLVVTFAASLLVGLVFDDLGRRAEKVAWGLAAAAFVLAVVLTNRVHQNPMFVALLSAGPFVLCAAALRLEVRMAKPLLVGVLFLDLFVHGVRINQTIPPERLAAGEGMGIAPYLAKLEPPPVRIFVHIQETGEEMNMTAPDLLERAYNALEANIGITRGFSYSFGYDPVEPIDRVGKYFGLDMDTDPKLTTFLRHRLLRLVDNTHSITNVPLDNEGAVVKVIAGPSVTDDPTMGMNAWAYRDPLPRARLYGNTVIAPNLEGARNLLHTTSFDPYHILILEPEGAVEVRYGAPIGGVRFLVDEPEHVRLEVESANLAWLFLADSWSEGWKATVNGHPVKIAKALVAFRAVPVPEGKSVVDFRYEPSWLSVVPWSFAAGLLALLGLFGPTFRERIRRRRAAEGSATGKA